MRASKVLTAMARAKEFADDNLAEGAAEIVEQFDTGIIKAGGIVRQLAVILNDVGTHDNLGVAQSLIEMAALREVAKRHKE